MEAREARLMADRDQAGAPSELGGGASLSHFTAFFGLLGIGFLLDWGILGAS